MIKLPEPLKNGYISLEKAIAERTSTRVYEAMPIDIKDLSQVLWSAYGSGIYGRTVPSAGACYPLRVYVALKRAKGLKEGVYRYQPHYLEPVKGEVKGFNYFNAPAYIILAANPSKTVGHYGKRGYQYVTIEAGHSAQNISLQATALKMGTVMIGAFREDKIKKLLGIEDDPLYIIPLGMVKQKNFLSSRVELAKHFNRLGFKKGAEIGVASGDYSEILCQSIPDLKLFCIDSWEKYKDERRMQRAHQHATNYEFAKKRLAKYDTTVIKAFSMDAVKNFADGSLDFVYIDGNHAFDYVMEDIIEWSKKVRKGGIVSGHDYYHFRRSGIVEAVNTYTSVYGIELNLTDKRNPKNGPDDQEPSFWWVKK